MDGNPAQQVVNELFPYLETLEIADRGYSAIVERQRTDNR